MKHYLLKNNTANNVVSVIEGKDFQPLTNSAAVCSLGPNKNLISLAPSKAIVKSHEVTSEIKLVATFQGQVVVVVNEQVIPLIFDTSNIELYFINGTDKPFKLKRLASPDGLFQSFEFEEFNFETTSVRFLEIGAISTFQPGEFEPLNEEQTEFGILIEHPNLFTAKTTAAGIIEIGDAPYTVVDPITGEDVVLLDVGELINFLIQHGYSVSEMQERDL